MLGCQVSEPSVQRVLAEQDADSGQVTVQHTPRQDANIRPPDRRRAERVRVGGWAGEGTRRQRHTAASGRSGGGGAGGSQCQSHTHAQLTTIARIHSKCQEANISSRIWLLSQLSSQGSALGSLWINYSETISLHTREIKVQCLQ